MDSSIKDVAIKSAQLQQLLDANGRSLVSSTLLAALVAYFQRYLVALPTVSTWLILIVLVNIGRLFMAWSYKRHQVSDNFLITKRLRQFRIGLFVSAFLWGSSSIILSPSNELQHQMLLIFVLTGMTAGAVISYSVDKVSAIIFMLLTLVPMLVRLFLVGDSVAMAMSVSGFLYVIFMIASIGNINRNLIESITLRFEAVERENEIKQLAFYDSLTNLPNRRLLFDRLEHALIMSARTGRRGALLFLDLDYFKNLNDNHGHFMGDLLLQQVAERLLSCVRESDTVARLGGDEFVVMLEDLSEDRIEAMQQVEVLGEKIVIALNRPYHLNALQHHCSTSIGIAMFGEHGNSNEVLLKNADEAMYQAKKAGRNLVIMFDGLRKV
ncbi:MAG: diguanylate cyclase [Methylotenera sp.]|nr:diguanylate cyclase [Methylotenera sp.]HPH07366.1 diguanylate cyclase [Methylotenera sp.]HPM48929.1 diguanylate cyclase [Methylotenera sp.]